jgi:predicted membrane metal-binding protein
MWARLIVITGLVFLFGLLSAQQSLAVIYKYVDKDGLITLVDDLQFVPAQFRASVKIVSGDAGTTSSSPPVRGERPEGMAGYLPRDAASAALNTKTGEAPEGSGAFGGKALVSAVIIVGSAVLFTILGIFKARHGKLIQVLRAVLLGAVSVYFLYAHAGDAVRAVKKIGGGIESAQQQSEEKGKKAAKAVKAWNELMGPAEQPPVEGAGPETEHKE